MGVHPALPDEIFYFRALATRAGAVRLRNDRRSQGETRRRPVDTSEQKGDMNEDESKGRSQLHFAIARPEDAELLLSLIEAYYTFDGIAFDASAMRRGIAELLANASLGEAWFVRSDAKALGYFILTFGFDLEFGGRQATMTDLFLVEDSRGRGIGRATLSHIETLLNERGIGALELQVEDDNRAALGFYERIGFTRHKRIPMSKKVRTSR